MDSHQRTYKNKGKNIEDLRRRRNEVTVELRKNKRDEALLKKRNIHNEVEDDAPVDLVAEDSFSSADLSSVVLAAMSPALEEKLPAIRFTRKLLSTDKNPPIDEVIQIGMLPILVDALQHDSAPVLQFEAAWALTNIASGNSSQTMKVVEAGAVPHFIRLLASPSENVAEQSLWSLGNIIGDGAALRDHVLQLGLMQPLLNLLKSDCSLSFLRNMSWVFVNICRNKNPPPSIEVSRELLPVLVYLLQHYQDANIVIDLVWTISYITDHGEDSIQLVIDSGIVKHIIPMLNDEDTKQLTPALRVIGNIATGTDEQTQALIDWGVLSFIPKVLNHKKDRVKREALWLISNITAGREYQIQALIDHNIIPTVINDFSHGAYILQKEAAWVISNMCLNGTAEHIKYLVEHNAIQAICQLLTIKDAQIIRILLEALIKIFECFEPNHLSIAYEVEKHNGLDVIEGLQQHENEDIYNFTYKIIDKYFPSSNDEIPDLVPVGNEQEFQFGNVNSTTSKFDL